jgi:Carboxypeptidase regulatory-like domain
MSTTRIGRRVAVLVRALIAVTVTCGALCAHAQNAGSLSGSVEDVQKAQIPGAKVTATRTATGESRETSTDGSGFYSFPVLIPGLYNISVQKDGFSPQTKEGVEIFTGQATALNFDLTVGQLEERIQVSTDVAQLATSTSSLTDEVENKTITNFPLVDRRATQAPDRTLLLPLPAGVAGMPITPWMAARRRICYKACLRKCSICRSTHCRSSVSVLQIMRLSSDAPAGATSK